MAKQVKVFNGSVGEGTIYTVPTGRVAKVELISAYVTTGAVIQAERMAMTPATRTTPAVQYPATGSVAQTHAGSSQQFTSLTWATPNDTILLGSTLGGGSDQYFAQRYAALSAGQSISMSGSGTVIYSFIVVEEY